MTASKIVAAAASGVGGAGLDVDEVFSTYLYDGTGSAQTITNGIDISGEGGLVWTKSRSVGYGHRLVDTVNGVGKYLRSESTAALRTDSYAQEGVTAFNSNGYSLGNWANEDGFHRSGSEYVSWTFRKAPKFFDVVTYSGNSTAGRTVAHNLGSVPGMIIVKSLTDATEDWCVYHRGIASDAETDCLFLNLTDAALDNDAFWNDTAPTSTQFTLGNSTKTNRTGHNFVAYLFAHNNSDGGFGPDADQDIIKCGSYTGNGSTTGVFQDLGFEPQWIMFKLSNGTDPWVMLDQMRGVSGLGANDPRLQANSNVAEAGGEIMQFNATGFTPLTADGKVNGSGKSYVYMAIRRGPLAAPEDATKVFAMSTRGATTPPPAWVSGFPVDFALETIVNNTGGFVTASRLTSGNFLNTSSTGTETDYSGYDFDYNNGWSSMTGTNSNNQSWMWKRAPSYFDVVAYTGTGSNRTVSHNLGAVPEMIWIKRRDTTYSWVVYHRDVGATKYLKLNTNAQFQTSSTRWNDTAPTSSVFTVGTDGGVNASGGTYISYLFGTVAGVSKVGYYTGSSSGAITVDCGFSSGARFVMVKNIHADGNWHIYDSVRGINSAADDAQLYLDTTDAETNNSNNIDPHSSGFIVNQQGSSPISQNGNVYIFLAIA